MDTSSFTARTPRARQTFHQSLYSDDDASSSSYPSSGTESEFEDIKSSTDLQESILALSEVQLRAAMARLASSPNSLVRRAIARELLPKSTKSKSSHRRKSTSPSTPRPRHHVHRHQTSSGREIRPEPFHPGELVSDVFEFPSRTLSGKSFSVARTITMWSCCCEDPSSVGCAV
ncbi:hypothetical protein C8J56DRAFT_830913 [Mycena floridula]|nr:hypothetical protein C8J56DRAFT_830913 [Mycena floridula]